MKFLKIRGIHQPVSVLGLGCIGGLRGGMGNDLQNQSVAKRINLLVHGFECGVNLFDTGEDYENGFSENLLGSVLKLLPRDSVIVSSKFKPSNNSYYNVIRSCNESLLRLGTDYLDIYQMQWRNPNVPLEETIEALLILRDSGKVRSIGLSNLSFGELSRACSIFPEEFSTFQFEFNVSVRDIAFPLSKKCHEFGIAPLGYRSVGFLKDSSFEVSQIRSIAESCNSSVSGLCLAWARVLSGGVSLVQTMNFEHLRVALSSADIELTGNELNLLEEVFAVETSNIPVNEIVVVNSDADETHPIYTTLEDALDNSMRLSPSPTDIALEIEQFGLLRPVEVIKISSNCYKLVQGRMRFWGWVIAKGLDSKIPCKVFSEKT